LSLRAVERVEMTPAALWIDLGKEDLAVTLRFVVGFDGIWELDVSLKVAE